jgi:hypothetical protein
MSSGGSRGSSFAVRTRGRRDRSPLAGSTTFDGKSVPRTTASADGQWRRVLRYPAIFLVLRVALRSGGNKMRSLQFHSQAVRQHGASAALRQHGAQGPASRGLFLTTPYSCLWAALRHAGALKSGRLEHSRRSYTWFAGFQMPRGAAVTRSGKSAEASVG